MECALCKRERELKNSHIVPEFIYTPLYDDIHRFHIMSSEKIPHQFGQKGFREKLLCNDCEQEFSRHENYVSKLFSGKVKVNSERYQDLVRVTGLNYKSFKLFGLSVLWRASVSSLYIFSDVKLGPHEEPLREQLLNGDSGPSYKYGFFLAPLVHKTRDQNTLIVKPTRSRLDGHFCYRFVFGGLIWVFVVSKHNPPKLFREAFVNEEGQMLMLVSELTDNSFIMNAITNISKVKNRNN